MIYIIEFEKPISDRHTTRYYIGWTEDDITYVTRMKAHVKGRGARLTQVAKERGIGWRVIMTFPGDRKDERRLKAMKNTPRLVERIRRGKCQYVNELMSRSWRRVAG